MQVALGHRRVVVPAAAEERTIAVDEARKRIGDAIDQRCGQRRIRSPDELMISFRRSQSRMAWGLSDSACDPGVKQSGNGAARVLRAVSPGWSRTRWQRPAASNSDANIPVSVTLSN
jgi:hypothetical protein